MTDIKSTAVVKYSALKAPAPFCELALNTNLNHTPEKWVPGRFAEKEPFIPGKLSAGRELNSFVMANNYLDYVGSVDAITDAENVKKLLKMPYNKACVSMMVHRIGKTLLIDQFDMYKHVLWSQQQEWKWLREFIIDTVFECGGSQALISPNKGIVREDTQENQMLSKFLYHSLADCQSEDNNIAGSVQSKSRRSSVPDPLESEDNAGAHQPDSIYERKVLWKLEDIHMLVGTDMPIFGSGTHPCVSLRLRDMKKPINVLTGIDYWLDQLMCNVPEVVMCYHLNGIVQKYEVIKTEDLPDLPDSRFNPEIVRDVAQNILSFLKSNATKEGHTYWLFKAHGDDVVKLYDLTSICKEYMDDGDVNPFTLPVAVLMYRVARNLLQKIQVASMVRGAATVYRLLNHCLELIDKNQCPQVAGSVHYLLATLYITCGWPASENKDKKANSNKFEGEDSEPNDFDDSFDSFDWFTFDDDPCPGRFPLAKQLGIDQQEGNCSCVSLSVLTNVDQVAGEEQATSAIQNEGSDSKRMPNCTNLEDCCKTALEHIYEGFECVETCMSMQAHRVLQEEEDRNRPFVPKPADTTRPIPLHYEPLNRVQSSAKLLPLAVRQPAATTASFHPELSALLMAKAATAYYLLAECSFKLGNYGKALRYVNMGLLCYESLRYSFDENGPNNSVIGAAVTQAKTSADILLPRVLLLCGDIHLAICHQQPHLLRRDRRDVAVQVYRDEKIAEKAKKALTEDRQCEHSWCTELPESMEQNLILSSKCYESAGKLIKAGIVSVDGPGGSPKKANKLADRVESGDLLQDVIIDSMAVAKRRGNAKNELGLYYMNVALAIASKEGKSKTVQEKLEAYWHVSYVAFQEGIAIFHAINDSANEALLHSNCARLMRTCAHAVSDLADQFGSQERNYYNKAIEFYQRALECLNRKHNEEAAFYDSVTWDLSSTYFTLATQLQERPPLRSYKLEEVEREIVESMHKALLLVENLERVNASKREVYLYRSSTIHHKLASLHYRLFVEAESDKGRKAKQQKLLADLHYSKAAAGFYELVSENPCEFIRVQLERAVLLEHCVENAGPTQKLKLIQDAVSMLLSCHVAYVNLNRKFPGRRPETDGDDDSLCNTKTTDGNEDAEIVHRSGNEGETGDQTILHTEMDQGQLKECQTLCDLTHRRLQALCKLALKLTYSGPHAGAKTGQTKENTHLVNWKRAYAITLKTVPKDIGQLPAFVLSLLREVSKELG